MVLYTDASVRHTPTSGPGGPSGAGAVLMDGQQEIFSKSQPLGHMDISVAEAKALLLGLSEAIKYCDQLIVRVDHQGLVQALTEDGYQSKGRNMDEMRVLVTQIKEVMSSYNQVKIELIKRKHNLANKLARKASKQQRDDMTRCEDLLVVVNQLEKALVGDSYADTLLPQVRAIKTKLTGLMVLLEESRSSGNGWVTQFEVSFSPMLSRLSQQLSQMSQKVVMRSQNWSSQPR